MRIAMHQSQYLPWPPYFKKIAAADRFVLMDNVQFQKNGVQNRNQIRNKQGAFWLTIPVSRKLEDQIANKGFADERWTCKHWKSLQAAYGRAPYWATYHDAFAALYAQRYTTLGEANEAFVRFFLEVLGIDTPLVTLSSLQVSGAKSELVLNACQTLGADCYVSGHGAADYLDQGAFAAAGIQIEFMTSMPPVYPQGHADFIPGLSMIDMLMHRHPDAIRAYLEDYQWANDSMTPGTSGKTCTRVATS